MGIFSGLFGGGGKQTTTQSLDPQTQKYLQETQNKYREAAGQAYTPTVPGASGFMNQGFGLMGQGAAALGGDPSAIAKYMNPYQQNVIDQLGHGYDRQREKAALGSNDAATVAGAYGGDRNALVTGERQGALDAQQMSDTAGLLQSGYNGAMDRAGQSVNLGMGQGNNFQPYMQEQRDWSLRNAGVMKEGISGMPYGTSTSTPTKGGGLFGKILGGGLTLGGMLLGGPMGAAAGSAVGNAVQGGGGSSAPSYAGNRPGTSYYG